MGRQIGEVVTITPRTEQHSDYQDTVCPIPEVSTQPAKSLGAPSALVLPDSLAQLSNSAWQHSTILLSQQVVRSPIPRKHYPLSQGNQATGITALGSLLILITLAVVVRTWFWQQYLDYTSFLRNPRSLQRIEEGASGRVNGFNRLCDLLFVLSSAYFLWRFALHFGLGAQVASPMLLVYITIGTAGYYYLRYAALHLGPVLLEEPEVASLIWRQEQYAGRMLWLVLVIIDAFCTYSKGLGMEASFWAGVALLSGAILYSWLRVGLTFANKGYRPFYFFLYLCALEALPILSALRWVNVL